MSKGNNSVAFAMMLLQRRLSSSLEAVHLFLERRRNKLEQLLAASLEERRKYYRQLQRLPFEDYEDEKSDHPLFKLAVKLTEEEMEKVAFTRYMISYPVPEPLSVSVYKVAITDGTGQELEKNLLFLGKRPNGEIIELAPYWLFQAEFSEELMVLAEIDDLVFASAALQRATTIKEQVSAKRSRQQEKVQKYLEKAFKTQYDEVYDKLITFQKDDVDHRNLALINQMNAKLVDIEMRRERRLQEIERQKRVLMKPLQQIAQLELMPNGNAYRVFPGDYQEAIEEYEKAYGRHNVKIIQAFGLVDFYSERFNGEPRYIIVTQNKDLVLPQAYLEDLQGIIDWAYIYVVKEDRIVEEVRVGDLSIRV